MPRQSDLSFAFAPASGAAFDVVSFRLEEAISRPYLLTVELSSIDPTVDFGTLLDKSALLTIRRGDTDVRYVHGIVTAFEQGKTGFRRTFYRAVVEPQLASARLRSDWKIFQQENAPAILQTVLKRSGINDAVQTLTKEHLVREYCVQPGETDFQFFQRLSAEEGLFYTHTFSATGHRLTLSDRLYIYGAIEGGPVIYNAAPGGDQAEPCLDKFSYGENVRTARQVQRDYPLYTSQCLLRLRELCKDQANEDVPSFVAVSGDGPPVFQDPEKERADVVADKTASLLSRLEKRYDEERRSKWQKAYEATAKHYQQLIDQEAGAYATSIKAEAFKRIDQYDYDSKQARSCASYVATMALCLRGGITDAKPEPKSDGSMPPSTGVTAMLWKSWITDPQSVVYKTLLARNDSLLSPYAGLIPGKDDNGDFSWGDSEKIYTPVTKIIASPDWGEELILPKVKGAIADVLAAYNGAVERLEKDVSKGIRPAATRLNSTALALYSRIWVTQLTVQITLRDYYQLLCDTTRQAQTEVANAIAKATGRAVPTEKQVRSVLMGGLLSLAVADPKLADRMVEVTLWVDSKARDIRNGLGNAVNHVTDVAKGKVAGSVSELKVLAGTLEPEARELLKGIMPSSEQVKNLTSRGLRGIGRSITSFELLASVGGTFLLAQGLRSTLDKLGNALGPQRNEAWMAVYSSSVGVVGGSIEGIGIGLKTVTGLTEKTAETGAGSALARDVFAMGKGVARFGAVMGATFGFFDAAQAGMAAVRTYHSGDTRSTLAYSGAAAFSTAGAFVLSYAAYFELSAMCGPVATRMASICGPSRALTCSRVPMLCRSGLIRLATGTMMSA